MNNTWAEVELGTWYNTGRNVPQDRTEAESLLRKASGSKDPIALTMYGSFIFEDDPEAAVALFKEAAEKGNGQAEFDLYIAYQNGKGAVKDEDEAMEWLKKSASHGYVTAQTRLADYYAEGHVVAKDMTEAAKWWKKAAEWTRRTRDCAGMRKAIWPRDHTGAAWGWKKTRRKQCAGRARRRSKAGRGGANPHGGRFYRYGMGGLPKDLEKKSGRLV